MNDENAGTSRVDSLEAMPIDAVEKDLRPGVQASTDPVGNSRLRVVEKGGLPAYDVVRAPRLLELSDRTLKLYLDAAGGANDYTVHILVSPSAFHHFGNPLLGYLGHHLIQYTCTVLPQRSLSEEHKSLESVGDVVNSLAAHHPRTGDVLLLVGGGALTDVGGFIASTWRRGGTLKCVTLPTTLISAVDASISPKNAVNVGTRKNQLGTYCPPSSVLIHTDFLSTLNRQALLDGVTEMLKVAIVGDAELFADLESEGRQMIREQFQSERGEQFVWRSAELFLKLRWDERFHGYGRSIRSFGHVFSRELESECAFHISHGEAVAIEIRVALHLATLLGILPSKDCDRILACFDRLDLVGWADFIDCDRIWSENFARMFENGERFEFPVPSSVGCGTYLDRFTHGDLERAIDECRQNLVARTVSTRAPLRPR
ncbi:MAG: hypothetical protein ABIP48_14465 [Planctomycetota bacterium]